jgi:hypothetical protein
MRLGADGFSIGMKAASCSHLININRLNGRLIAKMICEDAGYDVNVKPCVTAKYVWVHASLLRPIYCNV